MDKISLFLDSLKTSGRSLDEDGRITYGPSDVVIQNAKDFVKSLPAYYQKILDPEDCITATGHGTITFDWYYKKNFVSAEVGTTLIGWFTDLPDGTNPSSDGIALDRAASAILPCLNKVYFRTDI
jgi:hypothetical protein